MRTRGLWSVKNRLGSIMPVLRQFLKEKSKVRVLELGCGYGRAMLQLKQKLPDLEIIGMNLQEYPEQHKEFRYIYGDAGRKIPLPDNSINFIYSIAAIHFVKDKAKFIEEAFRVLRPGGEFRVNGSGKFMISTKGPDEMECRRKNRLRSRLLSLKERDIRSVRLKSGRSVIILRKHRCDETLKLV